MMIITPKMDTIIIHTIDDELLYYLHITYYFISMD